MRSSGPMRTFGAPALVLLVSCWPPSSAAAAPGPCADRQTSLVVRTAEHLLYRCAEGRAVGSVPVSLGSGGTGKRVRGDEKTPLGTYRLGTPRRSERFHLFIPVEYPTAEQQKAGYTGSDIGIHGPAAALSWAGRLNGLLDWTQGCVALESNEAITELAAWVKQEKPELVVIE